MAESRPLLLGRGAGRSEDLDPMFRREGGKSGDVGWPVGRRRDRPGFCCDTRLGNKPLEAGGLRDDQVAGRLFTNHEGMGDTPWGKRERSRPRFDHGVTDVKVISPSMT